MDDLLNAAVEAVALEGPEGCSVTSLWTLLEQDLPIGGIAALPAELKQVMWQAILERSSELDFFLPSEEAGGQSSSGPPAQTLVTNTMILRRVDVAEATGASIKAKPHVRDHALGIYDEADICVDPLQRAAVEAVGRSRRTGRLQSDIAKLLGKKAQNFHYVMKHLDTRGLCVRNPLVLNQGGASHHSTTSIVHLPRFAPTLKPGQTFKRDTATGETWVADDDTVKLKAICDVLEACQDQQALQSDLKVKCGFRAPSGHRLWRRLKARLEKSGHISELVVRFNGKSSSCIKLNKPYVIGSVDAEEGAAGEDGAEDEVRGVPEVQAEKTLEHQLLDVILQAGEEGIALVDIASKMGQSSKKMNVRVREVMAAYGMLETSSQQGKQVLRHFRAPPHLLDQYQAAQLAARATTFCEDLATAVALGEDGALPHAGPDAGAGGAQAGASGATQWPYPRGALPPWGPVVEHPEGQAGLHLAASDLEPEGMEVDGQEAPSDAGPQASSSSAVPAGRAGQPGKKAAKTGTGQHAEQPANQASSATAQVPSAQPSGRSTAAPDAAAADTLTSMASSGDGRQAPPASSGMPAIPAASRQQSTEPNTLALVVAAQPDSGELPMVAGGRALAAVKPQGRRLTTVQGERRLRLVLERLRTEGFLVVRELRRLFATAEAAEGLAAGPPKAPDPATIRRLLERAEAAKQLTVTKVAIPKVANRGEQEEGMRELQVVLPYGGGTTPELLSKIAAASSAINREAYNSASQLEAAGIAVPEVDDIPRLVPPQPPKPASDPGPGHGGHINKRKFDNGYVAARMKRARLLHMLICRLVGLGEWAGMPARPLEAPNTEPRPKDALRQSPSVFIYTAPPDPPQGAARKRGLALLSEHAVDLERDTKYSFLRDELLSAMTVDLFLQVIGSAMVYDGLHDLVAARKTLGDLSDEEKAKFVDSKASERLMVALEGLARQGLLQFVVTPKNAKRAARVRAEHTAAQFITCDTAVLDWPVGLAEGPSERSTGTQRMAFDLTLETQLTDYWARLECMCTSQLKVVKQCYPVTTAPECISLRAWAGARVMSVLQMQEVRERLRGIQAIDWDTCQQIAKDLNISYSQVVKLTYKQRRAVRLDRLGTPLPVAGWGDARVRPPHPPLPGPEVRGRRQAGATDADTDQPGSSFTARKRRRTAAEHETDAAAAAAAEDEEAEAEADGNEEDEEAEAPVEQENQAALLESRLAARRRALAAGRASQKGMAKRMRYSAADDKLLLSNYVRWYSRHELIEARLATAQYRGVKWDLTERQATKRLRRLASHEATSALMEELHGLLREVYERNPKWKDHPPPKPKPKPKQQKKRKRAMDAVLLEASLEAKRMRAIVEGAEVTSDGEHDMRAEHAGRQVAVAQRRTGAAGQAMGWMDSEEEEEGGGSGSEAPEPSDDEQPQPDENDPLIELSCEADEVALARMEELIGEIVEVAPYRKTGKERPRRVRLEDGTTPAQRRRQQKAAQQAQRRAAAAQEHEQRLLARKAAEAQKQAQKASKEAERQAKAASRQPGKARPAQPSAAPSPEAPEEPMAPVKGGATVHSMLRGRSLVQQWKHAVALPVRNMVLPADEKAPPVGVATAMELIKSLLFLANNTDGGQATPDSATALVRRFTDAEITQAFGYLRKHGQIYHGLARRPFTLSEQFKASLHVLDFPAELFEEAAAAHGRLNRSLAAAPPAADASEPQPMEMDGAGHQQAAGGELTILDGQEVGPGVVADLLARMAMEQITLRPGAVKVEPVPSDEPLIALLGSLEEAAQKRACIGPLDIDIPLSIKSIHPSAARPTRQPDGPTAAATSARSLVAAVAAEAAEGGPVPAGAEAVQETWLFRPSAVAADDAVRAAAERACLEAAALLGPSFSFASGSGGSVAGPTAAVHSLRAIRAAGNEGLSAPALAHALANPDSITAVSAPAPKPAANRQPPATGATAADTANAPAGGSAAAAAGEPATAATAVASADAAKQPSAGAARPAGGQQAKDTSAGGQDKAAADDPNSNEADDDSSVDPAALDSARTVAALLLRFGLLRRIAAFNHVRFIASEHSQRYLIDPPGPLPPPPSALPSSTAGLPADGSGQASASAQPGSATGSEQADIPSTSASASASASAGDPDAPMADAPAAAEAGATSTHAQPSAARDGTPAAASAAAAADATNPAVLGAAGGSAALHAAAPPAAGGGGVQAEVVLKPWLDHKGQLNLPFWRALTQRAVSVVVRNPGIPEDLLLSQLDALCPQNARELAQLLVQKRLLSVRSLAKPLASQAMPSFFRSKAPTAPVKEARFYFPELATCFSQTAKVVP